MENLLQSQEEVSSVEIANLSDVTESIEAAQNMDEIHEIQRDIELSVIALESCMVGADVLEGNIANEDALIESGEGVTPATVAQSERTLIGVRHMLGDIGYTGVGIDNQSATADPMSALVLGNEGAKETFTKIVKSIIEIFKRIVNSTKKVIAKIVVALSRTEKKAAALKKAIKDNKVDKPNAKVLTEKDAERVYRIVGGYKKLAKRDNLTGYLSKVYDSIYGTAVILSAYHELVKFTSSITDASINIEDDKDGAAIFKKFVDGLIELQKPKFNVNNIVYTDSDGETVGLPIFGKGKYITSVKVTEELEDIVKKPPNDLTEVADTLKKIKLGVIVTIVDEPDHDTDKVNVMTKAELKSYVDDVSKAAKGSKKYLDNTMKNIDKIDKKAKEFAKKASGNTMINRMSGNFLNTSRRFVTGLYVDSIFAYLSVTNGALSEAKIHFGYFKESSF